MKRDTKSRAIHRIKIIKGQLASLESSIQDDAYCMDILTQSLAAQRSLASLSKLMAAHHIEVHIAPMLASGDQKQASKATAELAQMYELSHVRSK